MTEIIFGFVGAVFAIAVFVSGVVFGRSIAYSAPKKQEAVEADLVEKEKKKAVEESEAFSKLMGYDIRQAYGIEGNLNE